MTVVDRLLKWADARERKIGDRELRFGPSTGTELLRAAAERIKVLETALIRCAEVAGEDGEAIAAARSGALKQPSVEEFAVQAIQQLRDDYETDTGMRPSLVKFLWDAQLKGYSTVRGGTSAVLSNLVPPSDEAATPHQD